MLEIPWRDYSDLLRKHEIAIVLLQEIRSQDALGDWAWDCKELRAWVRRCDKLIGVPPEAPDAELEELRKGGK